MSVIVVRQKDGTRTILTDGGLRLDENAWPFVETFDEVADALSAMHVLDSKDPRIEASRTELVSAKRAEMVAHMLMLERLAARRR